MDVLNQAIALVPTKVVQDWDAVRKNPDLEREILELVWNFRINGGQQRDVRAAFGDGRGQHLWEQCFRTGNPERDALIHRIYRDIHSSTGRDTIPQWIAEYKRIGGTLDELVSVNTVYQKSLTQMW